MCKNEVKQSAEGRWEQEVWEGKRATPGQRRQERESIKRMNEVEGISPCRRAEAGIWGFYRGETSCSCRRHPHARLDEEVVFVGIERVQPAQMVEEPRPRGAAIVALGAIPRIRG